MPIRRTGSAFESNLKIVGGSASSGSRLRMRSTRVRTSSAASDRSEPHSKFNRIWLLPSEELDSTRVMPGTALTACSMGRVISSSISSGPTPG